MSKPSYGQKEYERGFIDGMQKQMQSSVDKAVNGMARQWVGLTDEEIEASKPPLSNDAVVWELAVEWAQSQLKEKNT